MQSWVNQCPKLPFVFARLKDFVRAGHFGRRRFFEILGVGRADFAEDVEYLVDDLSGDEAARLGVHVLHEGHLEQRDARLDRSQDITVPNERVVAPLALPPRQPVI